MDGSPRRGGRGAGACRKGCRGGAARGLPAESLWERTRRRGREASRAASRSLRYDGRGKRRDCGEGTVFAGAARRHAALPAALCFRPHSASPTPHRAVVRVSACGWGGGGKRGGARWRTVDAAGERLECDLRPPRLTSAGQRGEGRSHARVCERWRRNAAGRARRARGEGTTSLPGGRRAQQARNGSHGSAGRAGVAAATRRRRLYRPCRGSRHGLQYPRWRSPNWGVRDQACGMRKRLQSPKAVGLDAGKSHMWRSPQPFGAQVQLTLYRCSRN